MRKPAAAAQHEAPRSSARDQAQRAARQLTTRPTETGPFADLPLTTTCETPERHDAARLERFEIHDEKTAGWYLAKLRRIEDEQEAIRAAVAQRLQELDADRTRLEYLFGEQLMQWARSEAQKRRRRTVTVPMSGCAITFRTVPARVEIQDKETAADVAQTLGLVRTAPDLAAYRQAAVEALESRGELLPGVVLVAESEKVSIRRIDGKDAQEVLPTE